MASPIVHAEIRSSDPDATRSFFGELFGWTYPTEGAYPGYTFVDTGVPDALYTAISPLQGDGVEDVGDQHVAGAAEEQLGEDAGGQVECAGIVNQVHCGQNSADTVA